jgi:hypothetical protein
MVLHYCGRADGECVATNLKGGPRDRMRLYLLLRYE